MTKLLIKNIGQLIGIETGNAPLARVVGGQMSHLEVIEDAFLLISGEKIMQFGRMEDCDLTSDIGRETEVIDATGRVVMPAFCDSHTHIVFDGDRSGEFVDKIKGLTYEEIARRGGGILNSAMKLHEASEEDLLQQALTRLEEMISFGTGAVEIKSGYGLNTKDELKMLRVIREIKKQSPATIRSTFLGAHAVPADFRGRQDEYVDLVVNEMLPRVAEEKLADNVDVFCDRGFFTLDETERIIEAAMGYGFKIKLHANELDYSGGIQLGVKHNALSVDHLEFTGDEEIRALIGKDTMPTILPGASFFLGLPWAPARKMINAGLPIAMASDYNPGTAPSGNMQLILSLACIKYKLMPEEAIHALTLNGAYAMGVSLELGSVRPGKLANLIVTKKIPGYGFIPYAFGSNKVEKVILEGKVVYSN